MFQSLYTAQFQRVGHRETIKSDGEHSFVLLKRRLAHEANLKAIPEESSVG